MVPLTMTPSNKVLRGLLMITFLLVYAFLSTNMGMVMSSSGLSRSRGLKSDSLYQNGSGFFNRCAFQSRTLSWMFVVFQTWWQFWKFSWSSKCNNFFVTGQNLVPFFKPHFSSLISFSLILKLQPMGEKISSVSGRQSE